MHRKVLQAHPTSSSILDIIGLAYPNVRYNYRLFINSCLFSVQVCSPEAHASNILLDSSTLKVKPDNKVVETECGLSSRWHILVFILLYLISFSPGLGPVPWAVNAEIYPLEIRSVGNGVASTANWIANFIVSQVCSY